MRQPEPYFRSQRQTWYVQIAGKQISLGTDKKEAFKKYHQLMADIQSAAKGSGDERRIIPLLTDYLAWINGKRSQLTIDEAKLYLLSFGEWIAAHAEHLGRFVGERLTIAQLINNHLTRWLDATWPTQKGSRRNAAQAVKRVFNWAIDEQLIKVSPIASFKLEVKGRREVVIKDNQWPAIYAACSKRFHIFLDVMRETGMRPQEVRQIEARHYHADLRQILFIAAEAPKGTEPRTVYLTEKAAAIIEKLVTKWPEGPIFRSKTGKPYTKNAIVCTFNRIRAKTNIKGLCCYVLRHTFATNALRRRVDSTVVGKLMGHKDLSMVARVYQHLADDPQFLAAEAARAVQPSPTSKSA